MSKNHITIEYYSDIHNEFRDGEGEGWLPPYMYKRAEEAGGKIDAILVLAGDIESNSLLLWEYLLVVSKCYKYVVFVPGNHEYYGKEFKSYQEDMLTWGGLSNKDPDKYGGYKKIDNLCVLDNTMVEIEDTVLVGSTLWTNFHKCELSANNLKEWPIADFHYIEYADNLITPRDMCKLFEDSENFIASSVDKFNYIGEDKRVVVVTHFPPSYESVHPLRATSKLIPYFNPEVDRAIFQHVDIWIYGHTHDRVNYEIDGCKIVTNPIGYPFD